MKLPPNDPPKNDPKSGTSKTAQPNGQSASPDWDDEVLNDKPPTGMSPEMARKMLELNPSLRAKGADTNFIINQSNQANSARQGIASGQINKPMTGKQEALLASARDVDHLFQLTDENFQSERRAIESQISILKTRLGSLGEKYLAAFNDKLSDFDPNLASPLTHDAMKTNKQLMAELGFTSEKFVACVRQKRASK